MDIFHAAILGVIEGITEFLPVSSTGHLILAARFLGISQTEFVKSFEIAIQLGAILAVVVLYGRTLLVDKDTLKKVLVAFLPTAVVGFLLYKIIRGFLLDNTGVVLASLFLGGAVLVFFEKRFGRHEGVVDRMAAMTYRNAFIIGLFQSLAVIPGVSRAAATIIGGLILGVRRSLIVEFSFLLAIPTMSAATGYDLLKNAAFFSQQQMGALAVGFCSSFLVALFSIRLLLRYIARHNFMAFGFYRMIVALVCWGLFWRG